ncbi:MAG TPA: nickel pincer cofactor biosynthesis protein LarC [Ruminococcaceae bacterium]|jgi:hypothetical protein|nr:nickel pincer cofactor biosynthesis protein LarC [Oscillospiraceae bacterium]
MKMLYLECNMGAAGDMLTAALAQLVSDPGGFVSRMNGLGLPGVAVRLESSVKCGIAGAHVSVTVDGEEEGAGGPEHHHAHQCSGMDDIVRIIDGLAVSGKVKSDALAVYKLIAEAESRSHGKPVGSIHFHEVGAMDAVADIVGVCLLMEELSPERVLASPVHVGSGQVRCAHGIFPVPAPATAYLLQDVPIYGGTIRGELCTPTGAALLKHFAAGFCPMPVMHVSRIGYGMGKKDFEAVNCVRAYLGMTDEAENEVAELSCNLDDMTPEAVSFAQEVLFRAGALDVYTVPIGMKKSRPGVLLACMCLRESAEKMAALMLRHTTTLGVRETIFRRYTLRREETVRQTPYGPIRFKTSYGDGFVKFKPEYEDIARAARENGLSLSEVAEALSRGSASGEPVK